MQPVLMQLCTLSPLSCCRKKLVHFIIHRPHSPAVANINTIYQISTPLHSCPQLITHLLLFKTRIFPPLAPMDADQYSPKSRNCFMESGEGENLEKCSICLGALARAAFFMINLTNFIVAPVSCGSRWRNLPHVSSEEGAGQRQKWSSLQPMGRREWSMHLTEEPMGVAVGGTSVVWLLQVREPSPD